MPLSAKSTMTPEEEATWERDPAAVWVTPPRVRQAGGTLSERQARILDFIHTYYREIGLSPTLREIMMNCDITSTSVVSYNLQILALDGHLRRIKRETSTYYLPVSRANEPCPTCGRL